MLLHHVDSVFHDALDTNKYPIIFMSKLVKGNASFSAQQRFLGWDINTKTMTIALPQH
jgi:hypothetical protein